MTLSWLFFLIDEYEEEVLKKMKFDASLQGVKLDEEAQPSGTVSSKKNPFLFKSQGEYEKMDPKDKEALHENMMSFYKKWFGDNNIKTGNLKVN